MKKRYFGLKFLVPSGRTTFGRRGWTLPKGSRPGKWTEEKERVSMCSSGWHIATANRKGLEAWASNYSVAYLAEGRGKMELGSDKACFAQARLVSKLGAIRTNYYHYSSNDRWYRRYRVDKKYSLMRLFRNALREELSKRPGGRRGLAAGTRVVVLGVDSRSDR